MANPKFLRLRRASVLASVLVVVFLGCRREPRPRSEAPLRSFSEMRTARQTIAHVKAGAPFRATVLSVFVKESTNLYRYDGFPNRSEKVVTNVCSLMYQREDDGTIGSCGNVNATVAELQALKNLRTGQVYRLPDAINR